jgi:hypothetical protein
MLNDMIYIEAMGAVFSAFLAIRIVISGLDYVRIYRDTLTYAAFAQKSLSDLAFWAGRVPFTYPLLMKFIGSGSFAAGENIQRSNPLSSFQVVFSLVSWGLLAFVFSRRMKHRWAGVTAFAVVLLFSASLDITLWDRILLSESATHSLFALVVAFWVVGSRLIATPPARKWIIIPYFLGLALATILFAFMRDTNSYLLLSTAVLMALILFIKKVRNNPLAPAYIGYIVLIVLIFFLENRSSDLGKRWQTPFLNVLIERVHQQPEMLDYFVRSGMPQSGELLAAQKNLSGLDYHELVSYNPLFTALRAWSETSGKSAFTRYLLTRPFRSIIEPFKNANLLVNGINLEYRQARVHDPPWITALTGFFYSHNSIILLSGLLVVLVAVILLWAKRHDDLDGHIPLILLVVTYPLMFIVWHGDAGEIERHSALIGITYRLSIWLLVCWLLDQVHLKRSTQAK